MISTQSILLRSNLLVHLELYVFHAILYFSDLIIPIFQVITTNTTFDEKDKKLDAKLTAKYAHSSGFTVEKLEVSPKGKVATETSLVNSVPGLKLEFKGNDSDKGDLSFVYNVPKVATFTGEIDALAFQRAFVSVTAGASNCVGGGSVDIDIAKSKIDTSKFALGAAYSLPTLFAGVKITNSLSKYSGIFSYVLNKELTFVGNVSYEKAAGISTVLAGVYKYNPTTVLKVKASSLGAINASVKQSFDPKFTIVSSVEIPSGFTSGYKFGINATLG